MTLVSTKKVRMVTYLTEEEHSAVSALADRVNVSVSEFIRRSVLDIVWGNIDKWNSLKRIQSGYGSRDADELKMAAQEFERREHLINRVLHVEKSIKELSYNLLVFNNTSNLVLKLIRIEEHERRTIDSTGNAGETGAGNPSPGDVERISKKDDLDDSGK